MDECLLAKYPELERDHFWWVSRRELIKQLIDVPVGMKILDVGCGSGRLAHELHQAGAGVVGVDTVSHVEWSVRGRDGPVFHQDDYQRTHRRLGEFDRVLALDVLEHVEDDLAFVEALHANTIPGGQVIVTVPAYSWLWSEHDEINRHFRRYRKHSLRTVLTQGGFEITRCGYVFFALVGPKLLARAVDRFRSDGASVKLPSGPLNRAALSYFRWEHRLATSRRDFLPAGTSVVAVAARRD